MSENEHSDKLIWPLIIFIMIIDGCIDIATLLAQYFIGT